VDTTVAVQFGQLLREARLRRGVSAEHIAIETGIPLAHLAALESGELHAVPGGMYRRAEARAYAEAVGLEATAVLSALQHALGAKPEGWASDGIVDHASIPPAAVPVQARENRAKAPGRQWGLVAALVLGGAMLLFEQTIGTPPSDDESSGLAPAAVPSAAAVEGDSSAPPMAPNNEPNLAAALGSRMWGAVQPPSAAASSPAGPLAVGERAAERERGASGPPATVLIVNTTPRGARVTVNGIGWGSTPVTIRHLPEGVQRVRVVKERFVSEERVVDLATGQSRRVAIPLRPSRPARR
jgi:cytoskeletal protein RodZ